MESSFGVRIGFSGDRATFELFRNRIRNYVRCFKENRSSEILHSLIGLRYAILTPDMDQILWEINKIRDDLSSSRGGYKFDLLAGLSSRFFPNGKSALYHFDIDGGYLPIDCYKTTGDGQVFALYYLKRYYRPDMTMREFAQLADFVIRYIDNERYGLTDSVGLDPNNSYPQIVYVPDDILNCPPIDGRPSLDCSPDIAELQQIRSYSEQRLRIIHDQQFFVDRPS